MPMLALPRASIDSLVAKLRVAGCVYAEDEARLLISEAGSHDELGAMVEQRTMGLPLEHILGWAEFCGMRIAVAQGVFVPRRRTELLVREATMLVRKHESPCAVVELCCGSGAVGAALSASSDVELHAVDVDRAAVQCARRNIPRATIYQGHLYEPLPASLQGRVDLIVANAPYVPTDEIAMMPAEARLHEPFCALDGGPDGLDVQREIAAGAPHWLRRGGYLLIETAERQASRTVEIFIGNGLDARIARCDELDATVVIGSTTC